MRVKSYLKKRAKEDLKALETENDRAFFRRLKESAEKEKQARKKKKPARNKRNGG